MIWGPVFENHWNPENETTHHLRYFWQYKTAIGKMAITNFISFHLLWLITFLEVDKWRRSHFWLTLFAHTQMLTWTLQAPYKHAEALWRESFLHITATTTWALHMTFSWPAARHTQSVQGSQLQTLRPIGCSLRTQPFAWMIDCTKEMK